MGLKICSLSSGSSGNATYIGSDRANILVDAGLPAKYIIKALNDINVSPCELDAILVSHEHTDHIKGIGALSRRFDIPIYANEPTWTSMRSKLGNIKSKNMRIFYTDMDFYIKDINVQAFAIPHDAAEPVGFCFYYGNKKISITTDLGHTNNSITKTVMDSDLILLEANHDLQMLRDGSYPWPLKRRIMGKYGHLSNEQAGLALVEMLKGKIAYVLLAHLSEENNFPQLAYDTVINILKSKGIRPGKDVVIDMTYREGVSNFYHIE
ncbi:MAG: MBL fold metallo-hydrolase [Clostridiales bacterium]|jgi:phosphoribosyl 1,2-cyclic phosphodiesterase|nr:MBL fold metallo-hydrolase [Clostridiales bacterium]